MITLPQIPEERLELLIVAPVDEEKDFEQYLSKYIGEDAIMEFELIFSQSLASALSKKYEIVTSGIVLIENQSVQLLNELTNEFQTDFYNIEVLNTETSKMFDFVCQASFQYLKKKLAYYKELESLTIYQLYLLLQYLAQIIYLLKPPSLDEKIHNLCLQCKISVFSATLVTIQQLENTGGTEYKELFDYKNDFLENLEVLYEQITNEVKEGFSIQSLSLFESIFKLKAEIMVIEYQKRLFTEFNEANIELVNDKLVIEEDYQHSREIKSDIYSPVSRSRHLRTKSEFFEQFDCSSYLVMINDILNLLTQNCQKLYISTLDCKPAAILEQSICYRYIVYLLMQNFAYIIIEMLLLPLNDILTSAFEFANDNISPELKKVYELFSEADDVIEQEGLIISKGSLFSLYSSVIPANFSESDVDYIKDFKAEQNLEIDDHTIPVKRLLNISCYLKDMLEDEIFGSLFQLQKPISLLLYAFTECNNISVSENSVEEEMEQIEEYTEEISDFPPLDNFEDYCFRDIISIDICEQFCRSSSYTSYELITNNLLCKLLRVQLQTMRGGKQDYLKRYYEYQLSRNYYIRRNAEYEQLYLAKAINTHEVPILVYSKEYPPYLKALSYFEDLTAEYVETSSSFELANTRFFELMFDRLIYRAEDEINLRVRSFFRNSFDNISIKANLVTQGAESPVEYTGQLQNEGVIHLEAVGDLLGKVLLKDIVITLRKGSSDASYSSSEIGAQILSAHREFVIKTDRETINFGEKCEISVEIDSSLQFVSLEPDSVTAVSRNRFIARRCEDDCAAMTLRFRSGRVEIMKTIDIIIPLECGIKFLPLKFIELDGVKYYDDVFVQTALKFPQRAAFEVAMRQIPGFSGEATVLRVEDSDNYEYLQHFVRGGGPCAGREVVFSSVRYEFDQLSGDYVISRELLGFELPRLRISAEFPEKQPVNQPMAVELAIHGFGIVEIEILGRNIILGAQLIKLAVNGVTAYGFRLISERSGRRQLYYRGKYENKAIEGCLGTCCFME